MNEYIGKTCPYCGNRFQQNDNVIFCSSCMTPHHYGCWRAAGGCTVPGCDGGTDVIFNGSGAISTDASRQYEIIVDDKTEVLYTASSVILKWYQLLVDRQRPDELFLRLCFSHFAPGVLKALKVSIRCANEWGRETTGVSNVQYVDLNADKSQQFGDSLIARLPDADTRLVKIIVTEVVFADNSVIQIEDEGMILPGKINLSLFFGNPALADFYRTKVSRQAQYVPWRTGDLLRCTCGFGCNAADNFCPMCGADLKTVMQYANKSYITDAFENAKAAGDVVDPDAPTASTPADASSAAGGAPVKPAKKKPAKEPKPEKVKQKKETNKKAVKAIIIIIAAVIVAAGLTCAAIFFVIPTIRYSSAEKAMESGDYNGAYETFVDLKDFKDSGDKAKESLYRKANAYKEEGRYSDAAEVFEKIKGYKDSTEQEKNCSAEYLFNKGKAAYEDKSYSDAASYFDQIINTKKEAEEWSQKAHYAYAEEQNEKKAYDTAAEHYEAAGDYKKAKEKAQEANYIFGKQCFDKKYYRQSYIYLTKVKDYKDVPDIYEEVTYQYGNWLVKHGSDDMALEIFTSLGDYKKSKTHINEIKYKYCVEHKDSSNNKTYKYLKQLKSAGYEDSALIYEELFSWKMSLIASNTKKDDFNSVYKEIGRKCKYFHMEFLLSDGPVDSTIDLSHSVEYPDGTVVKGTFTWDKLKTGDTFGLVFTDGLYDADMGGATGNLRVKIYNNDNGNLLAEFSVKIAKSDAQ